MVAPIGMPEAIDFAVVRMSGVAFECSMPHILPVRPRPAWTSSSISRKSWSFAIFAIRSSHPGGGTMYPPSPWTGSTKMPATSSGGATVFRYASSMMFAQYRSQEGYVSLYGKRYDYALVTWTVPGCMWKDPVGVLRLLEGM